MAAYNYITTDSTVATTSTIATTSKAAAFWFLFYFSIFFNISLLSFVYVNDGHIIASTVYSEAYTSKESQILYAYRWNPCWNSTVCSNCLEKNACQLNITTFGIKSPCEWRNNACKLESNAI